MTTLDLIGSSPKFRALLTVLETVAPVDCRVRRWFTRCESLELRHVDPWGRAPLGGWRMNSVMPPRTVEETPRLRACR